MLLKHVQDKVCRHCGAGCSRETATDENGLPTVEHRVFSCGADSVWWGMDNSLQESRGCPNNPARVGQLKRAMGVLEDINDLLEAHKDDLPERVFVDVRSGLATAREDLKRSL